MINISETEVLGWRHAIRGMRNPLNSWEKSDTDFTTNRIVLGKEDLRLASSLANAGSDHGKFLRFIQVYCDINAPFYWWKEFDTYRAGVEKNSCSTMHKIHSRDLDVEDFSTDHLDLVSTSLMIQVIEVINSYRRKFVEMKDKYDWWQLIQLLPNSYNQKRTCMISYAALRNMYHARKNHKLDEWHEFCKWIELLPYAKELIVGEKECS